MKPRIPVTPPERLALLEALRDEKMATSAHAYVRGSTARFYEWLESARGRSLPEAPRIWICGDCHVGNLGALADKKGRIFIQIRDLDQTVVGSPAHDVARLALSLAMAVRASDLPGIVTARVMEAVARGYEGALESRALQQAVSMSRPPRKVLRLLHRARSRSVRQLLAERVGTAASTLPLGRRFWPLSTDERAAVEKLVASARVRKLITSVASRDDDATVRSIDAAYWVKGCSSLGHWRAVALARVAASGGRAGTTALLDIKEARAALAPRGKGTRIFEHHGERVVEGARALSPALGERMVAARLLDRDVFVRELLPQDLKLEVETLRPSEAVALAETLATVVGVAHARQMEADDASTWLAAFRRQKASRLDAPAWLWAAVVDLVALHEGAYLEHCRLRGEHGSGLGAAGPTSEEAATVSHHL